MSDLNSLEAEVKHLQKRIHRLEMSVGIGTVKADEPKKKEYKPNAISLFFAWLREDWLMKLGAFLVILAVAWFVRFAFLNDWVGPLGRISLGLLAGAAVMAFGHLQINKRVVPGQVLIVTGEIMMLLTLYASQHYYQMFSSTITLAMMVLVVIAVALLSVIHDSKGMAVTALLGGAIAPILASSGSNDYVSLLRYIFILDLGVLAVVSKTGWRFLTLLALIISAFYSGFFWEIESLFSIKDVWILMGMFFGLFFVTNVSAIIQSKTSTKSDLVIAGFNGVLLLMWIGEFVPEDSISIVLSGVTVLMVLVSSFLLRKQLNSPLYIYSALGLVFLGAATAYELDGAALSIAFSLEALAAVALASYVLKSPRATRVVSALQVIPVFLAIDSLDSYNWRNPEVGLINEDFFVVLVIILSLTATAVILNQLKEKEEHPLAFRVMSSVASLIGIAFVWVCLHKVFEDDDLARGVALVSYTLVGVALMYYGTQIREKALHLAGALLLGAVVLRLLLVEVWQMALSGRIITFIAIGALLIATAFFEKKLK